MTAVILAPVDPYKGLPRRIHVGSMTYRVSVTNVEAAPALADCWGLCVPADSRIYLLESLPVVHAVNTTLHEVLHAIHFSHGLTDESTEEAFTAQSTNGLLEVFQRNPRFFNWVAKSIRHTRQEANRD